MSTRWSATPALDDIELTVERRAAIARMEHEKVERLLDERLLDELGAQGGEPGDAAEELV